VSECQERHSRLTASLTLLWLNGQSEGPTAVARQRRFVNLDHDSSKPICKPQVKEHDFFGRRRLLQERPRKETGKIHGGQEMLAYRPTNLQIGLTPDVPWATLSPSKRAKTLKGEVISFPVTLDL
jgi:hypothetical protein